MLASATFPHLSRTYLLAHPVHATMVRELLTDPFPSRTLFTPAIPTFGFGCSRSPFLGTDRLAIFRANSDRRHLTADIQYRFAQMDFPRRPEDSRALFLLSAQAGHTDAQFAVGVMQAIGDGGPPLPYAGDRWFRRAAASGHSRARYCWGISRLKFADAEGYRSIRLAADDGYDEAMYAYGRVLLSGDFGRNESRAYKLFRAAADKGNLRALFWVGVCLHDGLGVRADPTRAVGLLQKAGDGGLVEARDALKMIMRERWRSLKGKKVAER